MNHDVMKAPLKEQALADLLARWDYQMEREYVLPAECLGRVSAADLIAVNTIPKCRISAMDGYAVKSENFACGKPDVSTWVAGQDFVPADTGDDFPDEFDSVIAVEQLHYDENGILTLSPDYEFKPGSNIRPAGCMMMPGDLLVRKNTCITPELQANLLVGGIRTVPVIRRPIVAFVPTGSELTAAGLTPKRGENIECNSALISACLKEWGAEPVCYPIVRDDTELLEKTMDDALQFADIVILNGGSSRGTEDFNSRMLERRGSYFMHTVRTVPGRPVGIAIVDGKPVINMPGPTLAAWVVNDWLLHPMICSWYGVPVEKRRTVQAFLTEDLKKGPPVEVYTRVRLEKRGGLIYATPIGRSARTSELLRDGIGLLVAPVGSFGYRKGQPVTVQLMTAEELIPVTEAAPHIVLPENCSQCPRHCPADALSCGRGKAYFERLRSGDQFESDDETANALVELAQGVKHMGTMMKRMGRDTTSLLDALTEDEQAQLLALLKKQQDSFNKAHAARQAAGNPQHGRGGPHMGH